MCGLVDVITCANFGSEKLRNLDITRVQVYVFPTEMTDHPYRLCGYRATVIWYRLGTKL